MDNKEDNSILGMLIAYFLQKNTDKVDATTLEEVNFTTVVFAHLLCIRLQQRKHGYVELQ